MFSYMTTRKIITDSVLSIKFITVVSYIINVVEFHGLTEYLATGRNRPSFSNKEVEEF